MVPGRGRAFSAITSPGWDRFFGHEAPAGAVSKAGSFRRARPTARPRDAADREEALSEPATDANLAAVTNDEPARVL